MSNAVLGVDYPCYGEYKCDRCNKAWASLKCWRDFGQKCKSCNDSVKPNEKSLLPLFYYLCKKCDRVWKNKRIDMGQPCTTCNDLIRPIPHTEYVKSRIGQKTLFNNSVDHVSSGGLCEKCQKYGAPCSLTYASASNRNSSRGGSSTLRANESRQSHPRGMHLNVFTKPSLFQNGFDGAIYV